MPLTADPPEKDCPQPAPAALSACVIAFEEADRIRSCLESLDWCDEIVVVDSRSTDATRAIAAEMGARVIERDWPGYTAQKNFAVDAAANDWVLCLDADERVSEGLREEIERLRRADFGGRAGFEMPRLTFYLGAWIRHGTWFPDRQLRLFDRRRGRWMSPRSYDLHERVVLDAPAERLGHPLLHEPYRTLDDHLRTIDRYTTIMARGLHGEGRRARASELVLRPAAGFLRSYVLRRGFLDGWRGLLLAYLHAHYIRMKYAKLMALERSGPASTSARTPPPGRPSRFR
jgi:glycosyltransferase involved in cell wall biosynthesis